MEKKARLQATAAAITEGKKEVCVDHYGCARLLTGFLQETKKPLFAKYGLNHIVALIEAKKASLVVIAHDVDPH